MCCCVQWLFFLTSLFFPLKLHLCSLNLNSKSNVFLLFGKVWCMINASDAYIMKAKWLVRGRGAKCVYVITIIYKMLCFENLNLIQM